MYSRKRGGWYRRVAVATTATCRAPNRRLWLCLLRREPTPKIASGPFQMTAEDRYTATPYWGPAPDPGET